MGRTFSRGLNAAAPSIPPGTLMLFQQTAAPTGWTKQTTHNDKSLRIVSGAASSGGATAFSSVFGAGKSTAAHTLITAESPAHTHSGLEGGVLRTLTGGACFTNCRDSLTDTTTGSSGGGGSHSHTLTLDLEFVDIIIASKD